MAERISRACRNRLPRQYRRSSTKKSVASAAPSTSDSRSDRRKLDEEQYPAREEVNSCDASLHWQPVVRLQSQFCPATMLSSSTTRTACRAISSRMSLAIADFSMSTGPASMVPWKSSAPRESFLERRAQGIGQSGLCEARGNVPNRAGLLLRHDRERLPHRSHRHQRRRGERNPEGAEAEIVLDRTVDLLRIRRTGRRHRADSTTIPNRSKSPKCAARTIRSPD